MTRLAALTAALDGVEIDASERHLIARCDYATLAAACASTGTVADALIVDAPYSARTHAGHDDGTASANRVQSWAAGRAARGQTKMSRGVTTKTRVNYALKTGAARREIEYQAWTGTDVSAFVSAFAPLCLWFLSLTDHVLAREWERALSDADRYAFSPIACIEKWSRVRIDGTGPAQWATQLVVARPRLRSFLDAWNQKRWSHGLAPQGGYCGGAEKKPVTGGKPLWLMRAIVGDYTAPGDVVCDPCMGAGTTLVAAVELGRIALGCEPDAGRFEMARKRLATARPQAVLRLDVAGVDGEQTGLALGGR